jgi:hypothetical protein
LSRLLAFVVASLLAASAHAEAPRVVLRGVIAAVSDDAKTLTMKSRAGETVTVHLAPDTRLVEIVPATAADLKPNAFIGIAAIPDTGDQLKALEVHIFPESMRGTGEGFRPFDLAPRSSMTNGALNARVSGTDGDKLTVSYKGGSQTIRLPPDAPIVSFAPGDKADLKSGAAAIARGAKAADGSIDAAAVLVGKDGLVPPM